MDNEEKIKQVEYSQPILLPLLGGKKSLTQEGLEMQIEKLEIGVEKELVRIFKKIDISSSVKSNRKSLPFTNVVTHSNKYSSYVNESYSTESFFRKIIKELLVENVFKIRFFVEVEIDFGGKTFLELGKITYHFKYFKH